MNLAGSLSLTAIARAVGLPYATTSRLVLTLVHEGMLEKEPGRKNYRPTSLVQSLASGYQDHSRLGAVARRHIVALTERHGCPVAVSTRFGTKMIVRECTHTLSPLTLSTYYPGFVYPLLHSAAGLVYLAFSDERERALLRRAFADHEDADASSLSATSDEVLQDIRTKGYATRGRNRFTVPEGKNSAIAAPIFHQGELHGAVALIFLASSMRMDRAVEVYAGDVVATAAAISRDLEEDVAPIRLSA